MAGIVFGCVIPHPPLLIPDIGRGQEQAIITTIEALDRLAQQLADQRPELALLVSPHGHSHYDAMGVLTAPACRGDLCTWGSREPEYRFDNDLNFVQLLQEEAQNSGIPLKSIGARHYELDHGALVPLHHLKKAVKDIPLVPLTFSWLPLASHFGFGQAINRAAQRLGKRVAFIASGDMSHRLIPSAPAGYSPQGKVFDEQLVEALGRFDTEAVLNIDPDLIDEAGECGLRSIVIMLGALEGLQIKPEVLSYEGPFGVGYMVASFIVQAASAQEQTPAKKLHPLVRLAKDTVESYILKGTRPKVSELSPEMKERAGVFVCLKGRGQLRGCVGTFEPTYANVAEETINNAISSASRDPRFPPVAAQELPDLSYSVDVLTRPEPVKGTEELNSKRYGVIVEEGGRRGLLLPDLEGVDTAEQQIELCRMKAGISPDEPVKLYRFEVKRYQ